MQCTVRLTVRRALDQDICFFHLDNHVRVQTAAEQPFWAFDRHRAIRSRLHVNSLGKGIGSLPIRDIVDSFNKCRQALRRRCQAYGHFWPSSRPVTC